jgi:hypothetical protein
MPESMTLSQVFDVPFVFTERRTPIPCDLRPVWRLHILVLLIEQCRDARASNEQLHVLNWAIRNAETRNTFLQYMKGRRAPNEIVVRMDPSLTRALDFAFAEGLITRNERQLSLIEDEEPMKPTQYRVLLTKKGKKLAEQIKQMEDCFVTEKRFLDSIGKKVTQTQVASLFHWS